ncbi:MAG: ATP-binding protein [Moraxella sp.]|nr:ATP-binding protein [Moraxella sp.]
MSILPLYPSRINPLLDATEKMQAKHHLPHGLQMVQVSTDCPKHGLVVRDVVNIIAEQARHICPKCKAEQDEADLIARTTKERECVARQSGITHYKQFDAWQPFGEQVQRMQGIINFAQQYLPMGNTSNIIMYGKTGTGKTLLANLIASDFVRHGKHVQIIRASDIHSQVRATWSKHSDVSEHELMNDWINQDLLVIDELGEADGASNADTAIANRERISRIIDGRYSRNLPTIITTNLERDEIVERLGDRAWDRLAQNAVMIAFNWGSFRKANQSFMEI